MDRTEPRCPECGGAGWTVSTGCCGNFTKHGECRGHCAVPTQYLCQMCVGTGAEYEEQSDGQD